MTTNSLIISNARVVDGGGDRYTDVYVVEGRYSQQRPDDGRIVDAKGLLLMPAFVDLHCHFRQPGFEYKEDFLTGSQAAVAGGYTFVNMMANTKPVISSWQQAEDNECLLRRVGLINGRQAAAISENLAGLRLSSAVETLGAWPRGRVLSDDGKGLENDELMARALLMAKKNSAVVMSHAGYAEWDDVDNRRSENEMIARDIRLCEELAAAIHLCHVSTSEGVAMGIAAKQRGLAVSLEVTPHHLALTDECDFRVNPSLRAKEDQRELKAAIQGGCIDAIATDHAPHSADDKLAGAPGLIGLETAFAVCFSELVRSGLISLSKLSQLLSDNPSRILHLPSRRIQSGGVADFVLIDIAAQYKIDDNYLFSRSRNTPFAGRSYYGRVQATFVDGHEKYSRDRGFGI